MEREMEWPVGYRFHPNEEEIINFFLKGKMLGLDFPVHTIKDVVDICMYEPWELPEQSPMPREDRVWYFFNAPVPKSANSKLINRTTNSGFWKPTGRDRPIWDNQGKKIGFKKNLVFHKGRAPNGIKTNWVIHEYRSNNAAIDKKEYVLSRLKRKSDVKPDSGNHATENTNRQINHDQFEDHNLFQDNQLLQYVLLNSNMLDHSPLEEVLRLSGQRTSNSNGFDHNILSSLQAWVQPEQGTSNSNAFDIDTLSSLLSTVQQGQGTLYSDGLNSEHSLSREQQDAFVNSLLVDHEESSGEINVNTYLHDFNPTKPLSVVYAGDSSDTDTDMRIHSQGGVQKTSNLFGKMQSQMANESYSSSDGDAIMELDTLSVNSDTDVPRIFCLDRVVDERPTNTRTCKAQHTPKSHTRELQMRISHKAALSKVKVGEAAEHAVDLPKTNNSHVKIGKDKQMVRTTSVRTSPKSSSSSNRSSSSSRKCSFISLENPQLCHRTNPPSVFLFNVIVSLGLIILIIREMVYLH